MTTVVKIGTEFQVNSQTAGSQWYPSITGLTNGGFVVTWQDGLAGSTSGSSTLGDASGSAVKAQLYAADGSKVGGEFLVNTQTNGSQASPVVTGLSNGGFVVSWQDQNSTSGDIKAQIYGANGAPVGGEFLINSVTANNQNTPAITGLPNGGFVVAWTNQGSVAPDIKAQVYDANGAKVGSEFLVNSASANFDQERASIATLSNGDFVVTWNDFRTGNWEVRGQVFHPGASGATKVGSEFTVDTAYYNNRMVAGVTGLANGNFVISFEDTSGEIRAQVFTVGGNKVGSEFQVNTQTGGNQGFSSITALTGGGFVVTWSDEGTADGSGSGIKAQVYDAAGNKIGGEYIVNSQTNSYQYYPTVSALANGGFVISWQDFSQTLGDKSSYGITAQVFNLSNAPTAPTIVSVTDDVSPNSGALANGASTNDTNLTVRIATGSNFAGDVVQLFDGQTAIGSAVTLSLADVARGYIDIQTGVLGNAAHAVTAKVTDTTDAVSDAASAINVTVDTVAPAVGVTGVTLDTANLPTFTVSGTTEAGLLVSVYDGATLVGTTTAGANGSWSLAGVTLVEGANNLTAKTTDAAGNAGTSTVFAAPALVSTGAVSVTAASTTSQGYVVLGDGTLDVVTGGNVSGQITIGNGGVVDVLNGATTEHTDIRGGGVQYDYGTANDTTVHAGGQQHVYFGGSANGSTVEAGGFQYIDAGGSASDTVIDGGFQYVDGTAAGGSVGGGNSLGGGVATGVTVKKRRRAARLSRRQRDRHDRCGWRLPGCLPCHRLRHEPQRQSAGAGWRHRREHRDRERRQCLHWRGRIGSGDDDRRRRSALCRRRRRGRVHDDQRRSRVRDRNGVQHDAQQRRIRCRRHRRQHPPCGRGRACLRRRRPERRRLRRLGCNVDARKRFRPDRHGVELRTRRHDRPAQHFGLVVHLRRYDTDARHELGQLCLPVRGRSIRHGAQRHRRRPRRIGDLAVAAGAAVGEHRSGRRGEQPRVFRHDAAAAHAGQPRLIRPIRSAHRAPPRCVAIAAGGELASRRPASSCRTPKSTVM